MTHVSNQLSEFISQTRYEHLPPRTVDLTKRCLLDAIGVSLGATGLGEGVRAFIDMATEQDSRAPCTILGDKRRTGPESAAFANGALAHALDYEDSHDEALVHPNAPTIPAALAMAEACGSISGRQLIASVAIGCEVAVRMGLCLQVSLAEFGWYPPPILASFGATAAAASILRLDPARVRDALSLVQCQSGCSGEIIHSPHSVVRAVRDAFAARAGVTSAMLAARGITGFEFPLEGKAGFFATFARGHYDAGRLTGGLAESFEIERISFKPWPSCRGTHAAIEAALNLVQAYRIEAEAIEQIVISGGPMLRMLTEPHGSKRHPATSIDAKFSLPFTVASALVHGRVGLGTFLPDALGNEDVLRLAARIEVDSNTPGPTPIGADLQIRMRDGRTFREEVQHPFGGPDKPLPLDALVAKFMECAAHASEPLRPSIARQFAAAVLELENLDRIEDLTRLLR